MLTNAKAETIPQYNTKVVDKHDSKPLRPSAPFAWPEAENLSEILELANKKNELVLALFTGDDWCGPCMGMEKLIFSTRAFREWAEKKNDLRFVRVNLLEKHPYPTKEREEAVKRLNRRYDIRGWPSIKLLDATGAVVTELSDEPRSSAEAFGSYVDHILSVIAKERAPAKVSEFIAADRAEERKNLETKRTTARAKWETDFTAAKERARKERKLLLVRPWIGEFQGESTFELNVLLQAELDEWISHHCVAVKIPSSKDSGEQNPAFMEVMDLLDLLDLNGPPPACAFVDPESSKLCSEVFLNGWDPLASRKILEAGKKLDSERKPKVSK